MFPVSRRISLKCTAGAFWSLMHSASSLAESSSMSKSGQERTGLNWNKFVEEVGVLAESHAQGTMPSIEFVHSAAALGARVDVTDRVLTEACMFLSRRQALNRSPLVMGEFNRLVTFEILLLSLEPGYSIPLHDHPNRNGVSLCVRGRARVTNYDLHETRNIPMLKMRSRMMIGPTGAGTFTEKEGNIHTIAALQPTQLIDIFCPPSAPGSAFHWYKAEPDFKDQTILRVTSIS